MLAINAQYDLHQINQICKNTLVSHLGIEFTGLGADYLQARMPVDQRTVQPFGLLHGGASVALAESLGSMASACCLDASQQQPVGLEINANHLRAVTTGYVVGTARPIHLGSRTHVWEIKIEDDHQKLVCISRLTIMLLDVTKNAAPKGQQSASNPAP
ncbi:MAG: hotdog fold thioesterase [Chloroflexi bacterium]|nr:hotdog fold thioesterase [Chloroflexota bacterium]